MAFKKENLFLVGSMSSHRQLQKDLQKPTAEFAVQLGHVVWAWSYCHAAFCHLFAGLVSPQNLGMGIALWHTLQSDAAQRNLLGAAAEIALAKQPRMLARVEWARRKADSLSSRRNDIVHMATAFADYPNSPKVVPVFGTTAPGRLRRLQEQNLKTLFPRLKGDLIALGGYVSTLNAAISFPGHYPLPRRPSMRSIPNQSGKRKSHRKGTKRPRPRESSPA